ncbi:hypothetical protein ACFX1X_015862 [Malus domestica]
MAKPASSDATRGSSTASVIKAYSLPLILFVAAMFFQLFVVPKSFPPSQYDVLGIKSYSSIEEVKRGARQYFFSLEFRRAGFGYFRFYQD